VRLRDVKCIVHSTAATVADEAAYFSQIALHRSVGRAMQPVDTRLANSNPRRRFSGLHLNFEAALDAGHIA
jgi:hypothetical protein